MATSKNTTPLRSEKIESLLESAIAEGSAVLIIGQTADTFVKDNHLTLLPNLISMFSAERQMPTLMFSLDRQIEELQAPNGPKAKWMPSVAAGTPATVVFDRVFESLEKSGQPTTLIVDFTEALIQDGVTSQTLDESRIQQQFVHRVLSAAFRAQKHLLVFISRIRPVNAAFAQMPGITTHNITLPEQSEREDLVNIRINSSNNPLVLSSDMTAKRLGRLSGGLNLDALSRMSRRTDTGNPLTSDNVLDKKKELIRKESGGTLTIYDETRDMDNDIAGLAQLKLFVQNMKEEGIDNLRGLLLGPPGTGKTLCATAVAKAIDTIPISLAQVKSMWVGESERQFRLVIEIIKSNAPVTLILDECDQTIMGSRSGTDAAQDSSSVDTSLRGMLLEWMGDNGANNGISIIAMSNNANGVDPAFRDRLVTIPILEATNATDKAKIAMIQLRRLSVEGDEVGIAKAFAESPKNYTGRQIVKMLGKAVRTAKLYSAGVVGYEAMKVAISGMLRSFGPREELMSLRAVRFTDEIEYLPWIAARTMGDTTVEIPVYMKDFFSSDGLECDEERLDAYIAELVARGY